MADVRQLYESKEKVQILDCREPYEWVAGHVEGSIHIPLAQVMAGSAQNQVATDRPVMVICRVGNRSELAALMLQARGIDAQNVEGGVEAWEAAGFPLVASDGTRGRVV